MTQNMEHETLDMNSSTAPSNGFPTFLNVLTILTFIGSGLVLITAFYNIISIDTQRQSLEQMRSITNGNPLFGSFISKEAIKILEISIENVYLLQGSAILSAIGCLLGAFMMRKLKKSGLYLYMVASIVSIIIPTVIYGAGLMGGMLLFGHIFTIAFMIMYGVNMKYLKY